MSYEIKDKRIEIVVTPRMLERLDRMASEHEMSRSQVIRSAVLRHLSEFESQRRQTA